MKPEETARLFQQGAWTATAAWEPPAPEALSVPGVEIATLAGRGGMGAVYLGRETATGRAVAVKILPAELAPDAVSRERFAREAKVLSTLDHPNLLKVFTSGEMEGGGLFLVMEAAAGGDLRQRLRQGRPTVAEALAWLAQTAAGLDAAHRAGVIHRDLKPANLLLDAERRIRIGDFGLAASHGAGFTTQLTLSGTTMGTFDYMAPEQFEPGTAPTPRTDVFALAVVAYELLTGRLPKGAFAPVSSLAGLPRAVDRVMARALSPAAGERPATAGGFVRELEEAANSGRRGRKVALLAAGVAAAGLGVWLAFGDGRQKGLEEKPPVAPTDVSETKWISVLDAVIPSRDERSGGWKLTSEGLRSDGQRCVLKLPVEAGDSYDLRASFTREGGVHSVAFFLPTAAGPATIDFDGWERGIGGLQDIGGRDMRAHGETFPAKLVNGERHRVEIQVRPERLKCFWNGRLVVDRALAGTVLSITPVWKTDSPALPGLGSWSSPTLFHEVEFRKVGR